MNTYHIYIGGFVQGVGFRPFVCRIAQKMSLFGWVCNSNNGVHIEFNANLNDAQRFYQELLANPPANALISNHKMFAVSKKIFSAFTISLSHEEDLPEILLTPDLGFCEACKKDVLDSSNRRFQYAFTNCLNCGPRYSIQKKLPYDRINTTMDQISMCDKCMEEYHDLSNSRHFCQTNSCPDCEIPMHLYSATGKLLSNTSNKILEILIKKLKKGKIAAVKGVGGYLLICDATNKEAIDALRHRKHRPAKPFALLYKDVAMLKKDVHISQDAEIALLAPSSPIVLCPISNNENGICLERIAPRLNKIGVMLPASALLFLITEKYGTPLIATSANKSGAPIVFKDDDALANLGNIADVILTYNREIITPQDDSVIQFSALGHKIILRRSRGLSPAFFPNPFKFKKEPVLALGSELKSAFALANNNTLMVSQYLGDQSSLEAQISFKLTKEHLQHLVESRPEKIIIDMHPGYFVSAEGSRDALKDGIEITKIQHHKAHFGAVLAENNLMVSTQPVLGVIWDGTGYGEDRQICGSEFFTFADNKMQRIAHLSYFPQLLGDKMNREPRLSALSLLKDFPEYHSHIESLFSQQEWQYYQKLITQKPILHTSSMGRFLDGIAAILHLISINTYEGEAALNLETMAEQYKYDVNESYSFTFIDGVLDWKPFLVELMHDLYEKKDRGRIAKKVFYSLAKAIESIALDLQINNLAFSGGVFQNAHLVDIIHKTMKSKNLFFHKQLSPNDENIGFGQLACCFIKESSEPYEKDDFVKIKSNGHVLGNTW